MIDTTRISQLADDILRNMSVADYGTGEMQEAAQGVVNQAVTELGMHGITAEDARDPVFLGAALQGDVAVIAQAANIDLAAMQEASQNVGMFEQEHRKNRGISIETVSEGAGMWGNESSHSLDSVEAKVSRQQLDGIDGASTSSVSSEEALKNVEMRSQGMADDVIVENARGGDRAAVEEAKEQADNRTMSYEVAMNKYATETVGQAEKRIEEEQQEAAKESQQGNQGIFAGGLAMLLGGLAAGKEKVMGQIQEVSAGIQNWMNPSMYKAEDVSPGDLFTPMNTPNLAGQSRGQGFERA